jgi:hypothetical protein
MVMAQPVNSMNVLQLPIAAASLQNRLEPDRC